MAPISRVLTPHDVAHTSSRDPGGEVVVEVVEDVVEKGGDERERR